MSLHIARGTNTEMPQNLIGAYVPVFVVAQNHEEAAIRAVEKIREQGFEFLDIAHKKIDEINPNQWNIFINESWPEYKNHFPEQQEILSKLHESLIFFGPFAGYESKNNA